MLLGFPSMVPGDMERCLRCVTFLPMHKVDAIFFFFLVSKSLVVGLEKSVTNDEV